MGTWADYVVEPLGWALIHFLWQGLLVAIGIWVTLRAMRSWSTEIQYLLLCGGMLVMMTCPVATWIYLWPGSPIANVSGDSRLVLETLESPGVELPMAAAPTPAHLAIVAEPPSAAPIEWEEWTPDPWAPSAATPSVGERCRRVMNRALPWLVTGWLIGVSILCLRLLIGWRGVWQLVRRSNRSVPEVWQERLAELSARMRISRPIRLVESVLVEVPTVVGWLKPVILLPATAITGLNVAQLESLIAHELAHVRRHDYLVNIVQIVIETLLFYHPAVWWLSQQIRQTREICCDELAVATCGNRLTYAQALATIEEWRCSPTLRLAANSSPLRLRIRRILYGPEHVRPVGRSTGTPSGVAILMLAVAAAVVILIGIAPWRTATGGPQPDIDETQNTNNADDPQQANEENDSGGWSSFLALMRAEEAKWQSYSATLVELRRFRMSTGDDVEVEVVEGQSSFREMTTLREQVVQGNRFRFAGEDILTASTGEQIRERRRAVFDGQQSVAIEENCSAMRHHGRAEPPHMLPPHTWGIIHLSVNFPLSVYLAGTEAIRAHPKAGRYPRETGTVFEFNKVESEIVGEEQVEGLHCIVVRVKRWYSTNNSPYHQYLWIAPERAYHVVQSRTAFLRKDREMPHTQSRVRKWRQLAGDLWLPEVVEVFDISAEAVKEQRTADVTQSLTLRDAQHNRPIADNDFALPEVPADLPIFEFDAAGHLTNGPMYPRPLEPSRTTTLDEILNRLSAEELKYQSCELAIEQRNTMLDIRQLTSGAALTSNTRQRYVVQGPKKYYEEESEWISHPDCKTTSRQQKADDGKMLRTTYAHTQIDQVRIQAAIDLTRSDERWRGMNRFWMLHMPRTLSVDLRAGCFNNDKSKPMSVEYVGDEQIGEWASHKLKCSQQNSHLFLWLARDRNLWPVRYEWHGSWHAVLPAHIGYVEDLQEIGPGIWFPQRVVHLSFRKFSQDGLVASRLVVDTRKVERVSHVRLNPVVDDKLFSEVFVPKGTEVTVIDGGARRLRPFELAADGLLDISLDKIQELKQQTEERRRADDSRPAGEEPADARPPSRRRGTTATARLLDRLEQLNSSSDTVFEDGWLRVMVDIVELGPEAVPELIDELDATDDERMLRCLGFMLRAIDDPRAVPALIRAIPKTYQKPRSDMGLSPASDELFAFGKRHELHPNDPDHFGFGRPVREVCGALQKLTGQRFEEETLYHRYRSDSPPESRGDRTKFHDVAQSWAGWWQAHWHTVIDDKEYANVELPPLRLTWGLSDEELMDTVGEKTGLMLESMLNRDAKQAFYDIDTGRFGELPKTWREVPGVRERLDEVLSWAQEEGFDLMGTEYVSTSGGRSVYVLQSIGLEVWELDVAKWKSPWNAVSLDSMREKGRRTAGLLGRYDANHPSKPTDTHGKGSFLVVTSEGMPVLIHVGAEVRDDQKRPGHFFLGDPDLNPSDTRKGRRFAVMYFDKSEKR